MLKQGQEGSLVSAELKKNLGGALAIVVVIVLGVAIYKWQTAGLTPPAMPATYYTVDDGKTYFPLSEPRYAPFMQEGKEAVSVTLFAGPDKQPFVGFLFKYSQDGLNMLAGFKKDGLAARQAGAQYALVKRPGEKEWVPAGSAKGQEIVEKVMDPKSRQVASLWSPK